jgi:hypothetical protein
MQAGASARTFTSPEHRKDNVPCTIGRNPSEVDRHFGRRLCVGFYFARVSLSHIDKEKSRCMILQEYSRHCVEEFMEFDGNRALSKLTQSEFGHLAPFEYVSENKGQATRPELRHGELCYVFRSKKDSSYFYVLLDGTIKQADSPRKK